jgi:hypothetical protein
MAAEIKDLIRRQALASGLDPNVMIRIGQIESGLNPRAKNPNSSASGLFQFINSTGRQYGLTNPFDAEQNTAAAMQFTSDNVSGLRRAFGRDPSPGEIYLAHQQGLGGAKKLLSNPDALAASLVGNQAVQLNAGRPNMTAREFAQLWDAKMNGSQPGQASAVNRAPDASAFRGSNDRPFKTFPTTQAEIISDTPGLLSGNRAMSGPAPLSNMPTIPGAVIPDRLIGEAAPLPPPVNIASRRVAGYEDPVARPTAANRGPMPVDMTNGSNGNGIGAMQFIEGEFARREGRPAPWMAVGPPVAQPDQSQQLTPEFLASLASFLRGNA